jgi:hypothetical protein
MPPLQWAPLKSDPNPPPKLLTQRHHQCSHLRFDPDYTKVHQYDDLKPSSRDSHNHLTKTLASPLQMTAVHTSKKRFRILHQSSRSKYVINIFNSNLTTVPKMLINVLIWNPFKRSPQELFQPLHLPLILIALIHQFAQPSHQNLHSSCANANIHLCTHTHTNHQKPTKQPKKLTWHQANTLTHPHLPPNGFTLPTTNPTSNPYK